MGLRCPSVGTQAAMVHEPCQGAACSWWESECKAQESVAPLLKISRKPPRPCNLAPRCRWHFDATQRGETACAVRRSGDLCEHQGGEYNTFHLEEV